MKFEIYDFLMKSGNAFRAAHKAEDGSLKIRFTNEGVVGIDYSFRAVPSRDIGCPNFISLSQIESIIYIETIEL